MQFRPVAPDSLLKRRTKGVPPNAMLVQLASEGKRLVSADLDRTAGVTTVVGCLGTLLAASLPWVEQTFLNVSLTPSPIKGAGILLAILATASAVIASVVLFRRKATPRLAIVLIALALGQVGVAIWNSVAILREISNAGSHELLINAIGTGAYIGVAGSGTTFAGGLLAWLDRHRE
jgi:hypothetical protein